jgi:hypothetical protein
MTEHSIGFIGLGHMGPTPEASSIWTYWSATRKVLALPNKSVGQFSIIVAERMAPFLGLPEFKIRTQRHSMTRRLTPPVQELIHAFERVSKFISDYTDRSRVQ